MLGQLMPCGGGPPIPLLKPKLLVGRQSFCDIPLNFPTVSSRHCELEFREGFWLVRDLNSSNGTRVNGTGCTSQRLLPGDVLSVAKYRYTVAYTPPAGPQPAQRSAPAAGVKSGPPPEESNVPHQPEPVGVRKIRENTAAARALGELVPCGGGDPIPLHKPRLVVGRNNHCDIVLRLGTISGRHCQLDWTDGHWFVRDLGSHNGIRVDGVGCDSKCLMPGNVLWIASLRYRIIYTAQGAEPAAGPSLFDQSLLEKAGLTHGPGDSDPGTGLGAEDDPPRRRYSLDDPL